MLRRFLPLSKQQDFQTLFPNPDFDGFRFDLLHQAVLSLNSLSIEEAYQQDPLMMDEIDAFGKTPLSWAAVRGDLKSLGFLVQNGASIDKGRFRSALSYTITCGYSQCTEGLLNHGADVNRTNGQVRQTPIHSAAAGPTSSSILRTLSVLIRHGAHINALNSEKTTPLYLAIHFGNFHLASKLISLGADITPQSHSGFNALCNAILRNS